MTRTPREVASILLRIRMKDRPRRLKLDGTDDAWVALVTKHRTKTMDALRTSGCTESEYKMERWKLDMEWRRQDADFARWNKRVGK
jgi:hypothetical protein